MIYDVKSPCAGSVLGINYEVGEKVDIGSEVITLESMKMLIPIECPIAGTLYSVLVVQGSIVADKETLFRVEV